MTLRVMFGWGLQCFRELHDICYNRVIDDAPQLLIYFLHSVTLNLLDDALTLEPPVLRQPEPVRYVNLCLF